MRSFHDLIHTIAEDKLRSYNFYFGRRIYKLINCIIINSQPRKYKAVIIEIWCAFDHRCKSSFISFTTFLLCNKGVLTVSIPLFTLITLGIAYAKIKFLVHISTVFFGLVLIIFKWLTEHICFNLCTMQSLGNGWAEDHYIGLKTIL